MPISDQIAYIRAAASALEERQEEVNRLNVFPVPDGDTGTNMSMTVNTMVTEINALPANASMEDLRTAIVHGSLMGARGNSGVITSQIMRGICEGIHDGDGFDSKTIASAFESAVDIAFQAVRKPVEGTILTVLRDASHAARYAYKHNMERDEALRHISEAAYVSVQDTPNKLPVLKENGVVDAGGFGLAILFEGYVKAATGGDVFDAPMTGLVDDGSGAAPTAPKVEIEQINDWAGSKFTYCTEFLLFSEDIDTEATMAFLAGMGDCELLVGQHPNFKVHVHTNTPGVVLNYMTDRGQISEVHIHNMRLQSEERLEKIAADAEQDEESAAVSAAAAAEPEKEIGFVAVAAGSGSARTLMALGVDRVVQGGQTMNPSTKDILDAVNEVPARQVIIFPNNKNIILAAQQAVALSEKPARVIPTHSVPQSFSALFAYEEGMDFDECIETFEDVIAGVRTGEVTTAIKDAKAADGRAIAAGDVIGICEDSIDCIGTDVLEVALELVPLVAGDDCGMLTLLAGADMDDDTLDELVERIESAYPDLEVDPQRGEQPLYPIVMSAE